MSNVAMKSTSPDFSPYIIIWFDALDVLLHQVKIAIIGITAGGVGLDFSSAQNVVFLELPQSPSLMLQVQH
jgi:2',3'-cyclic-nucleotide 2'-phosphodiesterase (5'-nucleotidase family)